MRIWKKSLIRFILILFILFPSICTNSLFTNELCGTVHYAFTTAAPFHLQNINNSDKTINTSIENIDISTYKSSLICTTDTLSSSEAFQLSQSVNRFQKQQRILKFSFFAILIFIIHGSLFFNSEYIYTKIKYLIEFVTIYIHKSDGKKRLYIYQKTENT